MLYINLSQGREIFLCGTISNDVENIRC